MSFYLKANTDDEGLNQLIELKDKVEKIAKDHGNDVHYKRPKIYLYLDGGDPDLVPIISHILSRHFGKFMVFSAFSAGFSLLYHLKKDNVYLYKHGLFRQHGMKSQGNSTAEEWPHNIRTTEILNNRDAEALKKRGAMKSCNEHFNSQEFQTWSPLELANLGLIHEKNIFDF